MKRFLAISVACIAALFCGCKKTMLTQDQIEARLGAIIPDAVITEISLVETEDEVSYSGSMENDRARYDFKLDAYTGQTLWWLKTPFGDSENDKDTDVSTDTEFKKPLTETDTEIDFIGESSVKNVLRERFPMLAVNSIYLDEFADPPVYTGRINTEEGHYDFEVDAVTGDILELSPVAG